MRIFAITGGKPRFSQVVKVPEKFAASQIRRFNLLLLSIFVSLTLLYSYFIGRELYCKEHDNICSTIICVEPDDEEVAAFYRKMRDVAVQKGWNQSQNFDIWEYSTRVNWKQVYRNCSEEVDRNELPYKINK